MKKSLLIAFACTVWGLSPLHAEITPVGLELVGVDPTPMGPDRGKAPRRMPRVYQDDHILCFSAARPDYLINIVKDGEVVFTSLAPSGVTEFELPAWLDGECQLQLVVGDCCFIGNLLF